MPDTSRLFFALWPDDETRQALGHLNQSIAAKGLKLVQPHNLHATLVFLGQVNKEVESLIKQAVTDITTQPFTLTFDHLSYWRRPRILCLTCRQPAPNPVMILVSALETVAENCGLHIDTRPYTPHITLARHVRHLPNIEIEPIVWRAEAFSLVESCSEPEGVHYKVLQQWPFIKPIVNLDQ
ncbi:MAG: RNA 2',3'-cyclic phosphodiesterase [Methylobacter sp.]